MSIDEFGCENKQIVVMIHGHGGNHNESDGFDKISNGLAEQGFVVATLDLPGCGKSKESFQLNTMTNMKADVLDVIEVLEAVDEALERTDDVLQLLVVGHVDSLVHMHAEHTVRRVGDARRR